MLISCFSLTYHLHGLGNLLNVGDRLEPEPDKLQVGHYVFTLDAYSEKCEFEFDILSRLKMSQFSRDEDPEFFSTDPDPAQLKKIPDPT